MSLKNLRKYAVLALLPAALACSKTYKANRLLTDFDGANPRTEILDIYRDGQKADGLIDLIVHFESKECKVVVDSNKKDSEFPIDKTCERISRVSAEAQKYQDVYNQARSH